MTTTPTNRIQRIKDAHPWMLEKEVHSLIVYFYAALTRVQGLSGEELQNGLEAAVQKVCDDNRESLEELLASLPSISNEEGDERI
jgi:hypothetical protein